MVRRTITVSAIIVAMLLYNSGVGFGQHSASEHSSSSIPPHKESRFSRGYTPERSLESSYARPASPSRLMRRTPDDGGMTDFSAFYFSNDAVLADLIKSAIGANPAIGSSEYSWRAALQRIPQASALPDPMVSITHFIEETETRVGPQQDIISISQKVPWFGKLDARGEIALRDALAAAERYQAQIRDVVLAVKRAYYDLQYLDEALRITEEDKELLDHFEEIAQKRYATGKGIQQGVIKIQAEITRDDDRMESLRQQRESAAARLNTLLARPPHHPVPRQDELMVPRVAMDMEHLYETGRSNRHELRAARYMVEKGDQAVRLAKKEYFPDFTVGFNYIFVDDRDDAAAKLNPPDDNGRDAYAVMLGFNIPLWEGKNMSAVREAEEMRRASESNYQSVENMMEYSVRDGVLRAETVYEQIALYGRVLIPQAEQALDSTQSAYATGKLNALDLIDSERFLLTVRLTHVRLKADYMKALAEIERAIGTAFPAD